MPDRIYAIVAGELAEGRKISTGNLGKIPDIIRASFKKVNDNSEPDNQLEYQIIRMDEFLCISVNPALVLHSMLMLASDFRFRTYNQLDLRTDLRLSIGIGPAEMISKAIRESDGTAFRIADAGLRSMKRNQRIIIGTTNEEINEELSVACGFMDILIHDWSDEQAEALFLRLSGKNQMQISEGLNISQPAVNRRLKAAHYEAIEKFIIRYSALITRNF